MFLVKKTTLAYKN